MMKRLSLTCVVSCVALVGLSACTPVGLVAGTGASLGVASLKEGGVRGEANDLRIKALINDLWFKHDMKMFTKLNTTVDQGRVLITGVVQNPDDRVEAVRLAWQVNGVKQVINEIRVADSDGFPGYMRDQWISTRLRTALTFDKNVYSINYTIDTVQGSVYLMGVAHDQAELDRVIAAARTIPHVREVVSYVKLAGQNIPEQAGSAAASTAAAAPMPMTADYQSGPAPLSGADDYAQPAMGQPAAGRAAPIDSEALPPW